MQSVQELLLISDNLLNEDGINANPEKVQSCQAEAAQKFNELAVFLRDCISM